MSRRVFLVSVRCCAPHPLEEIDVADLVASFRHDGALRKPALPPFKEIGLGMDRAPGRWRRRDGGGRDHRAEGI